MTDRKHFKHLVRERMRLARVSATPSPAATSPAALTRLGSCGAGCTARRRRSPTCSPTSASRPPFRRAALGGDGAGASAAGSARATSSGSSSRTAPGAAHAGVPAPVAVPCRGGLSRLAARLGLHAEIHETGGTKGRGGDARRPARRGGCRRSPGSTPTQLGLCAASRRRATATAGRHRSSTARRRHLRDRRSPAGARGRCPPSAGRRARARPPPTRTG